MHSNREYFSQAFKWLFDSSFGKQFFTDQQSFYLI